MVSSSSSSSLAAWYEAMGVGDDDEYDAPIPENQLSAHIDALLIGHVQPVLDRRDQPDPSLLLAAYAEFVEFVERHSPAAAAAADVGGGENTCVVCFGAAAVVEFPCRHVVTCVECASPRNHVMRKCPACRAPVTSYALARQRQHARRAAVSSSSWYTNDDGHYRPPGIASLRAETGQPQAGGYTGPEGAPGPVGDRGYTGLNESEGHDQEGHGAPGPVGDRGAGSHVAASDRTVSGWGHV
jgi:hypothetical protein